MVKLRLRELQVRVQTEKNEFGTRLTLPTGLVVIRAENSSGKSTLVQSIIYALGLENMLSASRAVPLPHAITHHIDDEKGVKHAVVSSEVILEFENHLGTIVTVNRKAKSLENHNLITLIHGPALSGKEPETPYRIEDMYVRDGGAATSARGFHFWLAEFLGWTLPSVTRFDGKPCLLYLECMFPLMLVEQKKAWTGIQARMPTHFQIKDIAKRAIEFILNLSVFDAITAKQRLRDEKDKVLKSWQQQCLETSMAARHAGGIIKGLTESPTDRFAKDESGVLMLHRNGSWIGLAEAKDQDQKNIEELTAKQIPVVSAVSEQLSKQLRSAESELEILQVTVADLVQDISAKRSQLAGLNARLDELADDLRGNKELLKVRKMGSKHAPKSIEDHRCPTCHQPVDDSLLPQDKLDRVMSLDDSIVFIQSQQKIYNSEKDGLARSLAVSEAELAALRENEDEVRARIRAHKSTLVTEGHAPSRAAIEALLSTQVRLKRTIEAETKVEDAFAALKELSLQWARINAELKLLPDDHLSEKDRQKINELERLFQEHAKAFDVTSISPNEINISTDNYKPEYHGFDLEFDLSASDLIRTIWAYLHSLLELARQDGTNHLGLLVLDEPRQQETDRESFAKFFLRAQHAVRFGQQVIVTTSEKMHELPKILIGVEHTFIEFTGEHVLKKVQGPLMETDAEIKADQNDQQVPNKGLTSELSEDDDIPF